MTSPHYVHLIQRYPPALGGAESYFARLSRYLAQQGSKVAVHTSNALALEAFWRRDAAHLPAEVIRDGNVTIHRHAIRHFPGRRVVLKALSLLPHPWIQGLTLPASPQLPSLWSLARRSTEPITLIHGSAFPYTFPLYCGLAWARRLKIPFVLTPFLHLGDPTRPDDRTRAAYLSPPLLYLLREADRIFVQTELERHAVVSQGVKEDRVILQGLGVDPDECISGNRQRANERWSFPNDDSLRLGHLANLSQEKGTVDLLRAVTLLHERGVHFTLLLAGPSMPNFQRVWEQLPATVRSHVHLLGILKDEEKPDFFASLDVFVLPSRSDSFGLVLLEAWANGIPCVGYRAGGIAEVIRHEEDGYLAPCGDIKVLTDYLEELLTDDEVRASLGQRGQTKVLKDYRWEHKLEIVKRTYATI
ncbi:MAG TPA: glycosyltransferase family 4 protein [Gemmatales bacterium]|nr:glycosyltransferase family 4 protein [Gemmatales bacterium]